MRISLYVNSNKVTVIFGIGWYSGNEWRLLQIDLFHKMDGMNSFYVIDLSILKFNFCFGFDWEK